MSLKKNIHEHCIQLVTSRLNSLQQQLQGLSDSKKSETKSSAGDKHETGRAMMQLEEQKLSIQLEDASKQFSILDSINTDVINSNIQLGGLIETSIGWFYIATSIGKVSIDRQSYFVISPIAPMAQQMLGKSQSENYIFNGKTINILQLL